MKWKWFAALSTLLVVTLVSVTYAVPLLTVPPEAEYHTESLIDVDEAATTTSQVIELRSQTGISFQVTHGDITGDLTLMSSNDDVTYFPVDGPGLASLAGCADPPCGYVTEIGNLRSRYYRVDYDHDSGTDDLKVVIHVKGK